MFLPSGLRRLLLELWLQYMHRPDMHQLSGNVTGSCHLLQGGGSAV